MSLLMIFFILIGALSIAAAVGVVTSRQPIHSALFLLTHFITLAVLYVMLEAQFLAAIQVIVYAGGIVILILFVIMLIGSERIEGEFSEQSWLPYIGLTFGLVLLSSMVYSVTLGFEGVSPDAGALSGGEPYAVGALLYTKYILPVEIVAVLLLVALIGALLLARNPSKNES